MASIVAYKARWERIEKMLKDAYEGNATEDTSDDDIPVNLTPFFSHGLPSGTATSDSYWANLTRSHGITTDSEGWAHVSLTTSNAQYQYMSPKKQGFVQDKNYTLMLELKNLSYTGAPSLTVSNSTSYPLRSSSGYSQPWKPASGEGTFYIPVIGNPAATSSYLAYVYFYAASSATLTCDIRLSLYEGEYSGIYVPYVEGRA